MWILKYSWPFWSIEWIEENKIKCSIYLNQIKIFSLSHVYSCINNKLKCYNSTQFRYRVKRKDRVKCCTKALFKLIWKPCEMKTKTSIEENHTIEPHVDHFKCNRIQWWWHWPIHICDCRLPTTAATNFSTFLSYNSSNWIAFSLVHTFVDFVCFLFRSFFHSIKPLLMVFVVFRYNFDSAFNCNTYELCTSQIQSHCLWLILMMFAKMKHQIHRRHIGYETWTNHKTNQRTHQ